MTSFFKLWVRYAGNAISERMAYRGEYFLSIFVVFILELIGPIFAYIIYSNSPGFEGWTLYQLIFLQGIFIMVKGISFVSFYGIVWNTNYAVPYGYFDMVLLKPRNSLLLFIAQSFDTEDVGKIVGGFLIASFAVFHIGDVSLIGSLVAIVCVLIGIALFFCMALLSSAFVFRFIRTFRIYEIAAILEMIGLYPKSIYSKAIGTIFSVFVPILMVASIPAEAITGNFDLGIIGLSAITTFILVLICIKIWYLTIRRYSSAGG